MIYRVEKRVDVEASTPAEAIKAADVAFSEGQGEVTAVFDEDWNEVD